MANQFLAQGSVYSLASMGDPKQGSKLWGAIEDAIGLPGKKLNFEPCKP